MNAVQLTEGSWPSRRAPMSSRRWSGP